MAFSFGFSGDDFEVETNGNDPMDHDGAPVENSVTEPTMRPELHKLEDLLGKLPSKIAWNVVKIESPQGRKLFLPRRELFDVRMQLMAEDDKLEPAANVPGLDDADIRTNVYEGGFKSWECSFDLANLLLDRGPRKDLDDLCRVDHVLELGCGTAVPSSVLFQYAITQVLPLYFTFTDYNADVLELVTFPNLFLTWVSTLNLNATSSSTSSENENENTLLNLSEGATGDLDITPELKVSFIEAMKVSQINLTFVSGSWLPADPWICLIPTSSQMNTLILASETIYSPSALRSFTTAMVGILKAVRLGKAMIAAKRVYFGVGGSVDAFKVECAEQGAVAAEIENHGVDVGQGEGIRRCLLEVQMM